jgi:PST family polysaccharide transporter/teichuronic acid exporter
MTIKKQVVLGLKWTSFTTISLAIIALLKISILARFLDKADFGLMAIISFILGFINLFAEMGLSTAILHKQHIDKKSYASLFWLNFIISVILYGLLCLLAPTIAHFYGEEELNLLIPLMGINLIFSAAGFQFKTIETKNLLFKDIGLIEFSSALASLGIAVYLAIEGFGVRALVYSAIAQQAIANIMLFIHGFRKYGLLLHFNFRLTLPFISIGMYQVGGQIVNYFNRDLDILLIGKFFSADILGGYSLAKQLVSRPAQIINPILTKVAAPALAQLQDNLSELKEKYLHLVGAVATINALIYACIILFASIIVEILYGPSYDDIVILVRILCLYMLFRAIGNPIGALVVATGRTKIEFYWNLISLGVMPIFIYVGAQFGIFQVALAMTIAMAVLFVPSWKFLVNKMTGATIGQYLKAIFSFDFMKRKAEN